MQCTTTKMYVNKPQKRQANNGKIFWTFYTSLGKFTKGKSAGQGKGTLNFVSFEQEFEFKDKLLLTNCTFDLFTETREGKVYYKAILTTFDKPQPVQEELVNVDDAFPSVVPQDQVYSTTFGEKIVELPKEEIDADLQQIIDKY